LAGNDDVFSHRFHRPAKRTPTSKTASDQSGSTLQCQVMGR
jgi:hypothetical protein